MENGAGPIYCETLIAASNSFPIEPVNTYTSLIPFALGVVALVWLWKRRERSYLLNSIALFLALTGLGSALWHGVRTPLSLSLDVFPGLVAFLLIVWTWPYLLGGRVWSYATIVGIFGGTFVLTRLFGTAENNGPPMAVFFVIAIAGAAMVYLTYKKKGKRLALLGLSVIALATLAALVRSTDLLTCEVIPVGIHFLWHVFLGNAAFVAIIFLSLLREEVDD